MKKKVLSVTIGALILGTGLIGYNQHQISTVAATKENDQAEVEALINEFGDNWLNFHDIYKRNQSVKQLLTKKAIKDDTIDVNPHATYDSKGKVTHIYREINDPKEYLVLGQDRSKGLVEEPVINLRIIKQGKDFKIDGIEQKYARSVY